MQKRHETQVQPLHWEDPLGEGNGNPLQYSYLKNSLDRGAWGAIVHGHKESDMTKQLSTYTHTFKIHKELLKLYNNKKNK